MKKVLTCRTLNRWYVFIVLLYGVEAWTLTEAICKQLEAFEMRAYHRMVKISGTDRITNEEVIRRLSKQRGLLDIIKRRKVECFDHVKRNQKLLYIVIQEKIEGKRGPERWTTSWLKTLHRWYGQSTTSVFRKAVDKTVNYATGRQRLREAVHVKKNKRNNFFVL